MLGCSRTTYYNLMLPWGTTRLRYSSDVSVSSTEHVEVARNGNTECVFHDRERLWNILFDLDLIAWVVSWFVAMPPLYKIVSDLFFAVWLVRLVLIRKRYYKIKITTSK